VNILCIFEDFPWPQVTGYRVRLANVVRALTEIGEVDLFVALNDGLDPELCEAPREVKVSRVEVVHERPPKSKAFRLFRWCTGRLPLELLWRRWSRARRVLKAWRRTEYDLVWFGHVDGKMALGDLVSGPFIVDLTDLDDQKIIHRQAAKEADAFAGRSVGERRSFAHRFARRYLDPRDVQRWVQLQHRILAEAEAVTICSELDAERLDDPKVVVVPNGYEVPPDPGERAPSRSAVMTQVGGLWYHPNADAAWWFATDVLPLIRKYRADARFRVVGRTDELVEGLRAVDHVDLRGQVLDVVTELATTDVSVVPIRSGGGTRVKILEAFSYRLPVVSTSVGCEGLEVEDGVHLLVADDAQSFAAACLRLLEDPALARDLSAAARELVEAKYAWVRLRPEVQAVARRAVDQSRISHR